MRVGRIDRGGQPIEQFAERTFLILQARIDGVDFLEACHRADEFAALVAEQRIDDSEHESEEPSGHPTRVSRGGKLHRHAGRGEQRIHHGFAGRRLSAPDLDGLGVALDERAAQVAGEHPNRQ